MTKSPFSRRDLIHGAAALTAASYCRVLGPDDSIQLGVIGCGERGRHIKKMRGGAQSHLIGGDDGCFYVVKFLNNPQHRRILVNELVCSTLLRYLQIACADVALIDVTPEFLSANPLVTLEVGTKS